MADPVTLGMAAVSIGSTIFGGIEGAKGAAQKADAQTAMYGYKAAVAQANQRVAAQNAQQAIQEGGVAGQFAGLQGAQQLGHMTTAQAASVWEVGVRRWQGPVSGRGSRLGRPRLRMMPPGRLMAIRCRG